MDCTMQRIKVCHRFFIHFLQRNILLMDGQNGNLRFKLVLTFQKNKAFHSGEYKSLKNKGLKITACAGMTHPSDSIQSWKYLPHLIEIVLCSPFFN